VITADRTRIPVATEDVISNLDAFAVSVPTDSLRTVIDELDKTFSGTGPDLQVLLDSTSTLVKDARDNLPQTIALVDDAGTVLDTQIAESGNLRSFSGDLKLLAEQLKVSDPDLRRLIEVTPPAAAEISSLLRESGNGLSVVFANLLTTTNIIAARKDGLEFSLVDYPVLAGAATSVLKSGNDGTAHLGLVLNFFDPPDCTKGYEATQKRPGNDIDPVSPNTAAYCAEPTGSPINVRGSQNAPFNGVPKTPTPQSGQSSATAQAAPTTVPGTLGQPGLVGGRTTLASLLGLG
jgi:phospholipid/cholesterol/gamma-HCH transport system substrate-binding protein